MSVNNRKTCRAWTDGTIITSDRLVDLFATANRLGLEPSQFELNALLLPHFVTDELPTINDFLHSATISECWWRAKAARSEIIVLAEAAVRAYAEHREYRFAVLSLDEAAHVAAAVLAESWSWA